MVEVVLAQVPPARLLAGKVLGIGTLVLAQLVAVGTAAVASAQLVAIDNIFALRNGT